LGSSSHYLDAASLTAEGEDLLFLQSPRGVTIVEPGSDAASAPVKEPRHVWWRLDALPTERGQVVAVNANEREVTGSWDMDVSVTGLQGGTVGSKLRGPGR
jgi:hypothetical protein